MSPVKHRNRPQLFSFHFPPTLRSTERGGFATKRRAPRLIRAVDWPGGRSSVHAGAPAPNWGKELCFPNPCGRSVLGTFVSPTLTGPQRPTPLPRRSVPARGAVATRRSLRFVAEPR